MKNTLKFTALLLSAVMLGGCSGSKQNSQNNQNNPIKYENKLNTETAAAVISIETKNQSADVMDFITKPVAPHVAKEIASWTPGYVMPPEPYYEDCVVTVTDGNGNVTVDSADARVKVRGNWTTTYDKKPLKINFAEKQSMLGLNGGAEMKNWVLLAEYKDASMLRDKTALAVAREILKPDGLYAADAEFAEVVVNGEYYGLFLLTEMQQINKSRVNITNAKKDCTGTDIGYFMEFDGYYKNEDELQSFFVDYADNAPLTPYDGNGGSGNTVKCLKTSKIDPKKDIGITIVNDINSQEQHDFIENYVNCVFRIMYEAAYNDKAYCFDADFREISENADISPKEAVEKVVDIESLADMYILSELTCDADIYWSSFYMDADFGEGGSKKLRFEAPWDFDSSMGNKDRCADGQGYYASNIVPDVNGGRNGGGEYDTVNPWLVVLAYEDWYRDIVRQKWTEIYDSGTFERAYSMIENDTERLSDAFDKNYSKWNNIRNNGDFADELSFKASLCKNHKDASEYLSEWLKSRVEFLNGEFHK